MNFGNIESTGRNFWRTLLIQSWHGGPLHILHPSQLPIMRA